MRFLYYAAREIEIGLHRYCRLLLSGVGYSRSIEFAKAINTSYYDTSPEGSFVARIGGVYGGKRIRREIDIIEDLFEVDGLAR